MTIPASAIAAVNPGVVSAGGAAIVLNGLILTGSTAVPLGTTKPFTTSDAVSAFFGALSTEAQLAAIYFQGFNNSTQKPGNLLFAQYNAAVVGAYLRGGSLSTMTLAQLQTLTGVLTIVVDGVSETSTAINLAAATSFSNAVTLIAAAFTSGPTVAYDSQRAAFVFSSTTTGATSTIGYATGTLSAGLLLTAATNAVTSQGAVAATPAGAMAAALAASQQWTAFMTTFEPVIADKLAFAAWVASKGNRYVYAAWDTDANAIVSGNTSAFGPQVNAMSLSGSVPIYQSMATAAFVLGTIASIDFSRLNGRITFAFRAQDGLASTVTDQPTADTLDANGYNFYGAYAEAEQGFTFMYPGSVGGQFTWLDTYVNQIYMSSRFRLAIVELFVSANSVPYEVDGYTQIEATLLDPITAMINFGAIRKGVSLSNAQASAVNTAAGVAIDATLTQRGWYLQVLDPTTLVRGQRGTPVCNFWYMDGESVQKLVLASTVIQ